MLSINIRFRKFFKWMNSKLYNIVPKSIYLYIYYLLGYLINSRTVKYRANKYNLNLLKNLKVSDYKKSDTLFILGSGDSINRITQEQWKIIQKNDSLGFNFWLYHDFVPTFYVYEESLDKKRNDIFYRIFNSKLNFYKNTPFIVKDIEYKGITANRIPNNIRKNFFLSTEIVIFGNRVEFEKFLVKGYKFISFLNRKNNNVFLKRSGSLSYLLFLAEKFNYKKIVLCGIDLSNNKYFFDDPSYKGYIKPSNNLNGNLRHPTDIETESNIPMSKVIDEINEKVLKPKGVELYVGSKESALYPTLKYYFDM